MTGAGQPIYTADSTNTHVIHIFSFSKSYSLAGYRCGYVVVHNDATSTATPSSTSTAPASSNDDNDDDDDSRTTSLWDQMLKVQDTILISPSRLTQHVAMAAMMTSTSTSVAIEDTADGRHEDNDGGREWVYRQYQTLDESRDLILHALTANNLKTIGGTGSMYIMAQLPRLPSSNEDGTDDEMVMDDVEVCRLLVKNHGIAVIPGSFCGSKGWIRVCYANLVPDQTRIAARRLEVGLKQIIQDMISTGT
jgi:aspartate/methionine/tyrosine aminotransferase